MFAEQAADPHAGPAAVGPAATGRGSLAGRRGAQEPRGQGVSSARLPHWRVFRRSGGQWVNLSFAASKKGHPVLHHSTEPPCSPDHICGLPVLSSSLFGDENMGSSGL